jgi:hypothetical protein
LGDAGADATEQVENQVRNRAHAVFDIRTENPEEPHVADDVQPSAVEKHAGEKREESGGERVMVAGEGGLDSGRDYGVGIDEGLGGVRCERDLVEEDGHVHED